MLDLNTTIPGAKNFKYKEFLYSPMAIRHNIKNIPNKKELRNIEILARNILQPVRNKFGAIRILSGFRCKKLNDLVNGSSDSNHLRGEAVDIEPLNNKIKLVDVVKWIHYNTGYRELICEYFPNGWIHIAYRKGDNNKQLKMKDSKHNYNRVDIKYIIDNF